MRWVKVVDNNGESCFINLERAVKIGVSFGLVTGRDRAEHLIYIETQQSGVNVRNYLDHGHHTDKADAEKHAESLVFQANRGGPAPIPQNRTRRPIMTETDEDNF